MEVQGISEIVENTFGLWITALFHGIHVPNPSLIFEEHKEAFFWLVEHLLRTEKIKFCPPNELWHEGYDVWDTGIPTIMEYFRSRWPDEADSELSMKLTDYFYDIPAVLWVAPNGTLHGS